MKEIKKIVVIGNGKMAIDCVKIILESGANLTLILVDSTKEYIGSNLKTFSEKNNLPYIETKNINSQPILEKIRELNIDIIFSVNNFQIIGKDLRAIPKEGVINSHNAPLPRYAGLNACSWAIVNSEKEHGVSWHYVDEGVDSGDIIAQRIFAIDETDTALTLIMRCISEGTRLFREILPSILNGNSIRKKQDASKRLFYLNRQVPNDGNVSFMWDYGKFNNFIRGLNFNPFPNDFAYPKASYLGKSFYIDKIVFVDKTTKHAPGSIIKVDDNSVRVQIKDATISLVELRDSNKEAIKIKDFVNTYGVKETGNFKSG